jgi:hypothetical protein
MPKFNNDNYSRSEVVSELITILKKEASLFETFLELMEQQQSALVQNNIDELNRITDLQRVTVIESRLLSKHRDEIIEKLSLEETWDGDINITQLINSVSSGQALILGQLRDSILELNDKIMRVRTQNKMLIDRSRDNIAKTVELIGNICTPEGAYENGGKKAPQQTSLALDRRV